MSDPATLLERVQRRLRQHWWLQEHRGQLLNDATLQLRAQLLDTPERRERSCGNPYCPCADVWPACREWEGDERYSSRCPRCGAPRSYHDERAGAS